MELEGRRGRLPDIPQGVFRPKLLFLELVELELLARGETQAAVERRDALRELSMLLFEVRLLPLRRDGSSVVLGHVTSEVPSGFSSQAVLEAKGFASEPNQVGARERTRFYILRI